jgi:putative transposase
MDSFFRRIGRGEVPGYPRFRSRERYASFDFDSHIPRVEDERVCMPKLGPVKFRKYRELRGEVKRVTLRYTAARGWVVCFACDLGDPLSKIAVRSAIGIDVGLEALVTLSTGERIENPRFFRAGADSLARRQQNFARKRRGSNSRRAARRLVARASEHIRNQRLDYARKVACALFTRFDLIAHEDLAISRMARGIFAKSVHDAAWGQFLQCLALKAENAGKHVIAVDPRGTSQRCSGCGQVVRKDLSQREHRCDGCGLVLHRDENAARNVLALGLSAGQLTEDRKAVGAVEVTPSE